MSENLDKLSRIVQKADWSLADKEWFHNYLENGDVEELSQIMEKAFKKDLEDNSVIDEQHLKYILSELHNRIEQPAVSGKIIFANFRRIAAAAAILIIFSIGLYVFIKDANHNSDPSVRRAAARPFASDVIPIGKKATLTLANGSKVFLDDKHQQNIPPQGSDVVAQTEDKLVYKTGNGYSNSTAYNTLSTPKGGRYEVQLPDGSKVWLNSASSIRYPTAFLGKERMVELTGEGYFEVSKNKNMPFVVRINQSEIKVFGTHFNIMGYGDEPSVKTTLLEGSVEFVNGDKNVFLKPGQQSILDKRGTLSVASDVKLDDVMAWKNGLFHFENEDIGTIMRELSRSYDVEVVYNKKVDDYFYAEIPNTARLSDVLKLLELTGKVKFNIIGKKVIVNP